MNMLRVVVLASVIAAPTARAAGPQAVAVSKRSDWPAAITTPADFDRASRAEILLFQQALKALAADPAALDAAVGTKHKKNQDSVNRWLAEVATRLEANLASARKSCGTAAEPGCSADPAAFLAALGPEFSPWKLSAAAFDRTYALEQMRLAALFPATTSEILTFSPEETTGADWPDKTFLLTFDDGPTAEAGTTDKLMPLLKERKASGIFFVLGDALQARLTKGGAAKARALYEGQCVSSHGQVHKSHQHLADWQGSIKSTVGLIRETLPGSGKIFFRPPYGQRTPEAPAFVKGLDSGIMLWNLDSQDWNAQIAAAEVGDRIQTLMLLWRRGILLFHDVHPKVAVALPAILGLGSAGGVTWRDCHAL